MVTILPPSEAGFQRMDTSPLKTTDLVLETMDFIDFSLLSLSLEAKF
jgi:hypothetical protein